MYNTFYMIINKTSTGCDIHFFYYFKYMFLDELKVLEGCWLSFRTFLIGISNFVVDYFLSADF